MVFGSYTLGDILACLFYVVLFIPILLTPGYVAGWFLDLFSFRTIEPRWRILISVPLSIAITPITIYGLGRVFSWTGIYVVFGSLFVLWLALLGGLFHHESLRELVRSLRGAQTFIIWAAVIWTAIAIVSLVDLQIGNRLYFSVVTNDYAVRTAVTDAISRDGVVPSNPFYRLTGPVPLRYHYFWFLPCSVVLKLSGLSNGARAAINASVVWCGWGLMALVPMYFRFMLGNKGNVLKLRSNLGIAFFAVTGLDIFGAAWNWFRGAVKADMEWWNVGQITSWTGSLLWVPHNTGALVAGLAGFLVMWHEGAVPSARHRITAGVLAGFALASMVGDSVYVAIVMAAFLGFWTIYLAIKKEWAPFSLFCVAGIGCVLLALPYLVSLAGQSAGATFAKFSVRAFTPADLLIAGLHLTKGRNLIYFFFLPVQYLFELGVFIAVPVAYLLHHRQRKSVSQAHLALFYLALIPFLIATFFKSSVVGWSNDLGWRGFLPVQFVLLLWAADFFARRREEQRKNVAGSMGRWLWVTLIAIGVSSTVYGLLILRFHGLMADAGYCTPFFTNDRQLGRLTFDLRQGYEQMDKIVPPNQVIQGDPRWAVYDFFLGLYSHRATATFNTTCGVEYGGNKNACDTMYPSIEAVFSEPDRFNQGDIQRLGEQLKASAIVLYDREPAWRSKAWPTEMTPAVANSKMRVYLLGRQD